MQRRLFLQRIGQTGSLGACCGHHRGQQRTERSNRFESPPLPCREDVPFVDCSFSAATAESKPAFVKATVAADLERAPAAQGVRIGLCIDCQLDSSTASGAWRELLTGRHAGKFRLQLRTCSRAALTHAEAMRACSLIAAAGRPTASTVGKPSRLVAAQRLSGALQRSCTTLSTGGGDKSPGRKPSIGSIRARAFAKIWRTR